MRGRGGRQLLHYASILVGLLIFVVLYPMYVRYTLSPSTPKTVYPTTKEAKPLATVTAQWQGRIGNQLFQYASTRGIARTNEVVPLLPCSCLLRKVFKISQPCSVYEPKVRVSFTETKASGYDNRTEALAGRHTILKGYFQSWKYFKDIDQELHREFSFRDHIMAKAYSNLTAAERQVKRPSVTYVRVGIHVRRGDMKNPELIRLGYTVADASYFVKAMEVMTSRIDRHLYGVIFVVCSDDPVWVKRNINGSNVVFIRSGDAVVDLAILSLCDHVIFTVGTYGWWGAWLAGGMVIYYKDWPKPASAIYKTVTKGDYFLPHWTGVGK